MPTLESEVARGRTAQHAWSILPVRDRLLSVAEFRSRLVESIDPLTAAIHADVGRSPDEVVATDLLPTATAAKFLQTHAERILRPQKIGGTPLWLLGCHDVIHRRPHGIVGLIGTWNYPVFLTAVPLLHALAAGNGVLWKPSEQTPRTAAVLHDLVLKSGFPPDLVIRLPGTREAGPALAEADIDFLHFTGSEPVGRKLATRLGERLIPSTLELSGCDAMIVSMDANVRLAARAAWYGATLNAGQTCMATRRAFVHRSLYDAFVAELKPLVVAMPSMRVATDGQAEQMRMLIADAVRNGSEIVCADSADGTNRDCTPTVILSANAYPAAFRDVAFTPLLAVTPYDTLEQVIGLHNATLFGLTASVFTAKPADFPAQRLRAGAVVFNDVIVPTAHPRTPFGGRGASGWGVTQGADGLLTMTVPQVVTVRRGTFRPHVEAHLLRDPAAGDVTRGALKLGHGRTLRDRWKGLVQMIGGMRRTQSTTAARPPSVASTPPSPPAAVEY